LPHNLPSFGVIASALPFHPCATFAGSNLRSTLAISKGRCSPALPANVYDLSNPFGPQTFISQPSLSREPTIDTRQSPGLSPRWCSISGPDFRLDAWIAGIVQLE
jgi:hypothetical protein